MSASDDSNGPPPLVTGLNVVAVYVTDLARAKRFYCDTLGFEECEKMPPGVLLSAGKLMLYLEGGREETPSPGLSGCAVSPCLATGGVRAAFEHLQATGVPVVEEYRELAPGFAMFRCADPDGNVIEFAGEP